MHLLIDQYMFRTPTHCSLLTTMLFGAISACTAAPNQATMTLKDSAGQHTLTLTSSHQPIDEHVEFNYQLKGRKTSCTLSLTGRARKLTKEEIGPVDIDWNEYLPNGDSVRYARFKGDGTNSTELEIDVQSRSPRFSTFTAPVPASLKAHRCFGSSETIELTFFR